MSVFKKLVGFLFEEEEEITEEGELEPVDIRDEPIRETARRQEPIKTKTIVKDVVRTESVSTQKPRVETQTVTPLPPVEEKKHFTNIEIDDKEPKKAAVKATTISPRKVQRSEPTKNEFEFTPVISPIFGADENTVKKVKTTSVPPTRTAIPTNTKKNPLGTILSPIFGATEEDDGFDMDEREEYNTKPFIPVENDEIEAMAFADDIIEIDEDDNDDIVNVPLEDLLSKEEPNENEDDLLQFSLFGDDEVVRTEKMDDSYTIKE